MARTVLIIAHEEDLHADAVADHCLRRGLAQVRLSPSALAGPSPSLGFSVDASAGNWSIEADNLSVTSADDYVVFSRDWQVPAVPSTENLSAAVSAEEVNAFLAGWSEMLPSERCLDHPRILQRFDNKLAQIPLAKAAGLRVPQTLATNNPGRAKQFVSACPTVVKLLSHVSFTGMEGQGEFIYTSPIGSEEAFLDEVQNCPVLIQEAISKIADVRVTVVGEQLFPAVIRADTNGAQEIDFRARKNQAAQPFPLEETVIDSIQQLMKKMFARYAAIDLGLLANGELVFFEANLAGNWLWIEREAGLPISAALALQLATI